MNVSKDKVVSLTYELKLSSHEGEVSETVKEDKPLTFVLGQGQMLPMFEGNIEGLVEKDDFQFELKSKDAYGPASEEQVIEFPKDMFMSDGKIREDLLKIGASIPMQDANGNRFNGLLKSVEESTVTVDFNHPLAGDDLFFTGKIISIREATPEELAPSCSSHQKSECGCEHGDGHEHGGCC